MNQKNKYTKEIVYTAIQLGRLWGIAETLEKIPIRSADEMTKTLLNWSLEYTRSENRKQDIVKFFIKKKEVYQNS